MDKNYTAHVVSHTHWDREWYKTFQQFRMRLVDLTDALLDVFDKDPEFKHFQFDGQTIVLEDYLAIRPESESRIRKAISDGRLQIGPWYNLPDEFLVSGESIVRNMLFGRKLCNLFESRMNVGYIPDTFGHPSQLPQLLRGFGLDNAVLFRGITTDQVDSEFTWRSPDGSEVLAIKLPDTNAYSNWFYRCRETLKDPSTPVDPAQAVQEVRDLLQDNLNERPTTSQLLFMDGCDHVFAQFKTPEIIRLANDGIDNLTVKHSTLSEFIEAVKNEAPGLKVVTGEIRWANRCWKLQGILAHVMSSRIHLKQLNHKCETLLERYAEPLSTLAWTFGDKYPDTYLELAWKYLLKNAPHDSICGCSIDQVHTDMLYRYDQCIQICEELMKRSLRTLSSKIKPLATEAERNVQMQVFNLLGFTRTEKVETEVDIPGSWHIGGIRVIDSSGNEIAHSVAGVKDYHTMDPTPYDIPLGEPRKLVKLSFIAEEVPAIGYRSYVVEFIDRPNRQIGTMLDAPDTADNGLISMTIFPDGTFSILDKETGADYTGLLIFEDGGDIGDGYNYVPPMYDSIVTSLGSCRKVTVVEDSPVKTVFRIDMILSLPEAVAPNRQTRSAATVDCPITTYLTLSAGVKRVDIRTVFENRAFDHRLRVLFPSGLHTETSHAESSFDVVERLIAIHPSHDWTEPMPRTQPQKSFMDIDGPLYVDGHMEVFEDYEDEGPLDVGLTLINKGLPEYEVKDDKARTIALTLLRATGSGVGGADHQKQGQMQGVYEFEYSLYPHGGNWLAGESWKQSHSFNTPLITSQKAAGDTDGEMPQDGCFAEINGESFNLTAFKKSLWSDYIVVRGVNYNTETESLKIAVAGKQPASEANLIEEQQAAFDGKVKGRQIKTLLFDK